MTGCQPVASTDVAARSVGPRRTARGIRVTLALCVVVVASLATTSVAQAAGKSFSFLQAPFTQQLYGISTTGFFGGVAFAPDGDPLVDNCSSSGGSLTRFDSATTLPTVNGTSTLHPSSVLPSNTGCGLTNHPNGGLYSNTSGGVVKLDAGTGAQTGGPFGPAGNALGIAVDPQTGNLVYVGGAGLASVNAALTTTSTFASTTDFIDQIAFDPSGDFLFASDRTANALLILRRNGTVAQSVPLAGGRGEPDGIAFKASAPKFVVTNNTDGTMTRFDFPGDDFTKTPTQAAFATGGFRGDMAQVGPDGCLYVTQDGGRYDDGTSTGSDTLVRICPGFAPPAGVAQPPTVTITTPPEGATYTQGEIVNANYSCAEGAGGPGLKAAPNGCVGTVPAGSAIDTSATGPHTFTVTANSQDGQSTARSTHYSVTTSSVSRTTCVLTAVRRAGPGGLDEADVRVTAPDGLASFSHPVITNGTLLFPSFAPGTTAPVIVTARKTTQGVSTVFSFDVTDSLGRTKHCA